jgi:imidazole glycerol-phosphate synthase subunit HisH
MSKVDLVDVGGGNTGSVKRCLQLLDIDFVVAGVDNPPQGERPVVLPGVGAFGPVMTHLKNTGFDQRIRDLVKAGTPYLGICVGMQILFESSEEGPGVPGLGLISGTVRKFREGKVPQIGWNLIELSGGRQATGFPEEGYVYFVNSFYGFPDSESDLLYTCNYYVRFCAAVQRGNITAFQFHPEKSGAFGKTLLTRWLENVG